MLSKVLLANPVLVLERLLLVLVALGVQVPHCKRVMVRWPLDRIHHRNRHPNRLHQMCTIRLNRPSLPHPRQRTGVMVIPLAVFRKTRMMMTMTMSVNQSRRRYHPHAISIRDRHRMVS
uniref:Putative secreted protein n=1 Tax=Anopheles darlingi TaxID=43151 RepID=A0A2M4D5N9_ANODA